jgi:uncharacterized protein (DUF111 family)
MQVESIGYGAGGRNPVELPNLLRLIIGELDAQADVLAPPGQQDHVHHHHTHVHDHQQHT